MTHRPDGPLRILQLHNHHAGLGGAMEVLAHEREMLQAAGHQVEQYTLAPTEQLGLSAVRAGAKAIWNVEAARDVGALVRTFGPHVVHAHTPFPLMSPAVFRSAKRAGAATAVTLHSFRFACVAATCYRDGKICEDCVGRRVKWPAVRHRCYHDSAPGTAALAAGLMVHRATGTFHHDIDRYLALTGFARNLMIRDGFPGDKIVVKPNSVPDPPAARFEVDEADPYVLFAARLIDVKGVRTLLDAWRGVRRNGVRLVIAGDGDLSDLVAAAAEADPSITWTGWLGQEEVTELMAGALATLLPSEWYEGLPLVILRSLSVGTPMILSDLENFAADVVADDVGFTFRVADAVDLRRTLDRLFETPELLRAMRRRARESFDRRYSPAVDVARLESLYRQLVSENASSAGRPRS